MSSPESHKTTTETKPVRTEDLPKYKENPYSPERPWTDIADVGILRDITDLTTIAEYESAVESPRIKYLDTTNPKKIKRNEHFAARNEVIENPDLETDVAEARKDRERREAFGRNDQELRGFEDAADNAALENKAKTAQRYAEIGDAYKAQLYKKYEGYIDDFGEVNYVRLYNEKLGGSEKIKRNIKTLERAIADYLKTNAPDLKMQDIMDGLEVNDLRLHVPKASYDFVNSGLSKAGNDSGEESEEKKDFYKYIDLANIYNELPRIIQRMRKEKQATALRRSINADQRQLNKLDVELDNEE